MKKITVIIVEDEDFFMEEFSERINSDERFQLINTYKNAESILHACNLYEPDVLIADLGLPGISGIELIKQLKISWKNTQILVCTKHSEDDFVFNAICNGASGYVLKSANENEFLQAIIELYQGGSPMSFQIARKVLGFLQEKKEPKSEYEKLTKREHQIVEYLSQGLRYKEMAILLNLSEETIRKHIQNIYRKLEVQSRTEAINKIYPR